MIIKDVTFLFPQTNVSLFVDWISLLKSADTMPRATRGAARLRSGYSVDQNSYCFKLVDSTPLKRKMQEQFDKNNEVYLSFNYRNEDYTLPFTDICWSQNFYFDIEFYSTPECKTLVDTDYYETYQKYEGFRSSKEYQLLKPMYEMYD